MARCHRCDACESMWDTSDCKYCGYPGPDTRSQDQVAQDDKDFEERVYHD